MASSSKDSALPRGDKRYYGARITRGPNSQPTGAVVQEDARAGKMLYEIPAASGRDASEEAAEVQRETRGMKAGGRVTGYRGYGKAKKV